MYTKDRDLPGQTKKWRIKRIDELNDDELDEFYCTWLADSVHELVLFLSLLQKSLSLDELLFRNYKLTILPRTLLTITVPEIRTTGGTTPIVTHCATRAEFLRHSMYEAVSLNAIMAHESQRLHRKATFSKGFLQS